MSALNTIRNGFVGSIGHTPLIRLGKLSQATGCEILGKAEFLNPGGSVKDRAALGIIEDAERRGLLKPGSTVVEGTAGNTGIGLTHVGLAKGYKTVIIIPNTQSPEKIEFLRALGADVRSVPPAPYSNPENYNHIAKALAEENGWFWANQFDNTANRDYHEKTTGQELWDQTGGNITGFSASIGTGGTLAGVARSLKARNPSIRIACADPYGASMWSWFKNGNTDTDDGDSVAEGIGQNRVTANIKDAPIDHAFRIPDTLAIEILYHLLREEGLFLSLSSAINVAGALMLAKRFGPGQIIATILCDGGARYQSRLWNKEWLKQKNLVPQTQGLGFLPLLDEVV